jgi:hypothetical protein
MGEGFLEKFRLDEGVAGYSREVFRRQTRSLPLLN